MTVVETGGARAAELDIDPFCRESLAWKYREHDALVRETAPVSMLTRYNLYAFGRYEQITQILGDWRNFTSAAGTGLVNAKKDTPWRKQSAILEQDPPQHTRTRAVLARFLTPAAMAKMRADLAPRAEALVAGLIEKGECDGIRDLAQAFVFNVLPDAVGFAEEGRENLLPYACMTFNSLGPQNEFYEAAVKDAERVLGWVGRQCQRDQLTPDGFGAGIYAAADAGEISYEEAGLLIRTFITAAMDTTIYGIGSMLQLFAENPDQWRHVREDPSLARAAFDEALRHSGPAPYVVRTTSCPVEFCGVKMEGDQKIILFVNAANHDPRRWDEPDRFNVKRKKTPHLTFGTSIHGCIGQTVARMEGELLVEALARHVEAFELTDKPTPLLSNWLRGSTKLPLALIPRRR